jgi:hypothetical protein
VTGSGARDVAVGIGITAVVLAIGAAVGIGGWPGEPSGCIAVNDCYCEAFTGGVIEQPVNTLSNFGFVAVGLWILRDAARRRSGGGLFAVDPVLTRLYGAIAVFLGVGSMFFHGTMTEWGGWLDLVSMHFFITFFLLYDVARLRRLGTSWIVRSFAAVNVVLAVVLWVMDNGYGKFVFGAIIVLTLVAERQVHRAGIGRDRRWFWAGIGTYVAGQVVWLLSRDGAPWCDPSSLWQGHALWHLTSAAAVALLYRYLRSEAPLPAPRSMAAGV